MTILESNYIEINNIPIGPVVTGLTMINYQPYNPEKISFEVGEQFDMSQLTIGLELSIKYGHIDGRYRIIDIKHSNWVFLELIK